MSTGLEDELHYYRNNLDKLIKKYNGLYVLIKGQRIYASFTNEEAAFEEGRKFFGNSPFLVKKVEKQY
ncbi:MAG: hypothetical protein HQK94_17560 [Nitrospirae bacterium]|nr:hypothetical protein [Nitrospirota bacterium]